MNEFRLEIPTRNSYVFVYLRCTSGGKLEHLRYDPVTGEPETILLTGSAWVIEFEDEIDVKVLR